MNPRLVTRVPAVLVCLLAAATPGSAQPLTPAFTFQGELRSGSAPASGLHDLRFRLYDAPAGGAQVGGTLCSDNVAVTDGRFTVLLDFGAAFAGQQRFLEIEVRADTGLDCSNPAGFTVLAPRQALTSTPNASFALTAATATSATTATTATNATLAANATQLNGQGAAFYQDAGNLNAGTIPDGRLSGTYSGALSFNNAGNTLNGTHSGSGAALTGLNASNIASGTLSASRLPIPLSLASSLADNAIIDATNSSAAWFSTGVRGLSSAPTGLVYAGSFENRSDIGVGLYGFSTAAGGVNFGGYFANSSTTGRALLATANATSGINYAIEARTSSPQGYAGHFSGPGSDVMFVQNTGSGRGIRAVAPADTAIWALTNTGLAGVDAENTGPSGIGLNGLASSATGLASGVRGQSNSTSGIGVLGRAVAASGTTTGVHGESASGSGRGVFGLATAANGSSYGVFAQSVSTGGIGLYGWASASSGANYGVFGQSSSPQGYAGRFTGIGPDAVLVYNTGAGRGVQVITQSDTALWATTASGFAGVDARNAGAAGAGVYALASSATGATYGVSARSDSTTGTGVFALAGAATGSTFGVDARNDSTGGIAVRGAATATSGFTEGGRFDSASPFGTGVFARATSPSGNTDGVRGVSSSTTGIGVYGIANSASGTNYGVLGQSSSASGWGLWANGRSGSSGTKSFRIDHPADPENKYLLHYSTESPEVLNAYRGTVTLDGAGGATVELPSYFARVNKSPSYQLTAVGAPMPLLHVAEEISEADLGAGERAAPEEAVPICTFRIAGGTPGAKVSWRVEALRNDLWMRNRAAPVEADKEGAERGTYQQPEFYGRPQERGMRYEAAREADQPRPDRD